jgi:hypothetical protein
MEAIVTIEPTLGDPGGADQDRLGHGSGPSPARKPGDFDSSGLGSLNTTADCTGDVMAITKVRFLAAARTGKNRIMIYGPRTDGTYIVEFETASSQAWPCGLIGVALEIAAVQLGRVEGVQENAFVMVAVADAIDWGHAVVVTGNRLDDARARTQAGQCLDNQRKAIGKIIAGAAVEPHLCALLAGNDPKAVVLNLVQPFAA